MFADIGGFRESGPDIVSYLALDPPHVLAEGVRSMRRAMSAMQRHEDFKLAQELEQKRKAHGGH